MQFKKIKTINDVAAWRMCMGCGACKWACPNNAVELRNIADTGIRPVVDDKICEKCGKCLEVCPGVSLTHDQFPENIIPPLKDGWGPVLEIYEGYAAEENIRYSGSSGGIATALALYAVEKAGFAGVLHIKPDPDNPFDNIPVFSRNRQQILETTGSRYAPAAPCQAFDMIKNAHGPCLFIGKPCDVAALRKARKTDPLLDEKVGLAVSIFCAGTPSANGTMAVLKAMGVSNISDIESFRYRGQGWPGLAKAVTKDDHEEHTMTYEDAWGHILSKHVTLRCRLCPDGTGEFADISCGDPWYMQPIENDPGQSMILVRSSKGSDFLNRFLQDSRAVVKKSVNENLPASQVSLYNKRSNLNGRLMALKLFGIPTPEYEGFSLEKIFKKLPFKIKFKAFGSTIKRAVLRKWYLKENYDSRDK